MAFDFKKEYKLLHAEEQAFHIDGTDKSSLWEQELNYAGGGWKWLNMR